MKKENQPVLVNLNPDLIGRLDTLALNNDFTRTDIIRMGCKFIADNPAKFKLRRGK
jgi:hypothetical protein